MGAPPAAAVAPWLLAQDVQVDRRRLDQGLQPAVDLLHALALGRLALPAALHDVVDLGGAGPRALQLPALRDALDSLVVAGGRSG